MNSPVPSESASDSDYPSALASFDASTLETFISASTEEHVPNREFPQAPATLSAETMIPLPCEFGDYDLLEEVARGGMGIVFRARQRSLDRIVALKMIRGDVLKTDSDIKRFYGEAQTSARLDHPHIVAIHDVGSLDGRHYFSMAFVAGYTLKNHPRRGQHQRGDIIGWMIGIASAVDYAHRHGIIHRDLKPDNVLIDESGRPRVTDFGLAKRIEGDAELTHAGQVIGTPAYMAPEQALTGSYPIGPLVDVYGLGGILYFLLAGKSPYSGKSLTDVLCQVVNTPVRPPAEMNAHADSDLERICLKCLEKDPQKRYGSASELLSVLRELPAHSPDDSSLPSTGEFHAAETVVQPAPVFATTSTSGRGRMVKVALLLAGIGLLATAPFLAARVLPRGQSASVTKVVAKVVAKDADKAESATVPPIKPDEPRPKAPKDKNVADVQPIAMKGDSDDDERQKVTLEMHIVGARLDDGIWHVDADRGSVFEINVDINSYVAIWTIDPEGNLLLLFPNEHEKDNFVRAGHHRTVPGMTEHPYHIKAEPVGEAEVLYAIATRKKWTEPPGGKRVQEFLSFARGDIPKDEFARGIVLRGFGIADGEAASDDVTLTELTIPYLVDPR